MGIAATNSNAWGIAACSQKFSTWTWALECKAYCRHIRSIHLNISRRWSNQKYILIPCSSQSAAEFKIIILCFADRCCSLQASNWVQKFNQGQGQLYGRFKQLTDLQSRNPPVCNWFNEQSKNRGLILLSFKFYTSYLKYCCTSFLPLDVNRACKSTDLKILTYQSLRAE